MLVCSSLLCCSSIRFFQLLTIVKFWLWHMWYDWQHCPERPNLVLQTTNSGNRSRTCDNGYILNVVVLCLCFVVFLQLKRDNIHFLHLQPHLNGLPSSCTNDVLDKEEAICDFTLSLGFMTTCEFLFRLKNATKYIYRVGYELNKRMKWIWTQLYLHLVW